MVTLACDASTRYVKDDEDERHQGERQKGTYGRKQERSDGMPPSCGCVLVVMLNQASTKLARRDDDG